ncbi:MAG: Gx transporter family protein [Huintestinicola sp.]|uniref:Gx transporter family protein n=1 Tax=Huintestinicola sp. TaxID=2981661 RepID=UPI003F122E6A
MDKKRITQMGLLTCIALIIFVVEMQIPLPVPVPGMKLGLANIVTVYAVYRYTPKETALILTARIILGSIFSGNPSALIFSTCGGILCLMGMIFLKRFIDKKHIYLNSIIGAVLHNIGQLSAAAAVMGTMSVFAYLPVLTVAGCIAGLFTGICAQIAVNRIGVK